LSSRRQRKLAAIVFTDMVGYTGLGQRNESLALDVLEAQRKLVRPLVAQFDGREVKTIGDAFLIQFPNALDAVNCAYEIQKSAKEFNNRVTQEKEINLRIGIHLGDVIESEGDISGDAVNVASRVGPLAETGGVCLTRQVYDQVRNKFELPLTSLGAKTLKNVATPIELYKVALPWQEERISLPAQPGDWNGAEAEFKKALELNPGYAQAHQYYADFVKSFGRFDEALEEMRKALVLDPLSYSINTGIGHVLYLSRQYDLAIDQYRKVVESDPSFIPARLWFGRPYLQKGMFEEAIEQVEEAVKLSHETTVSLATLAQAFAAAGRIADAKKMLDKLLTRGTEQYVPSYWIALVYTSMGNKDDAMKYLERAFIERSSWLVWANVEPRFDSLRSDARFASLLARIGFKPAENVN